MPSAYRTVARVHGDGITFDVSALKAGTWFDTQFENRCMVTRAPNPEHGYTARGTTAPQVNFSATDSEGVECEFSTAMVAWIHK